MRLGARRLPDVVESSIQPASLLAFRKAGGCFTKWAADAGEQPSHFEDWDEALVAWAEQATPSLNTFQTAIAAIEFFHPKLKNKLLWAHSLASRWAVSRVQKHSNPGSRGLAALYGSHLAAAGVPRLGFLPIFQGRTGLRPGEAVRLRGQDAMLPPGLTEGRRCIVFRLGKPHTGTKAKREQFAVLWEERDPAVYRIAQRLVVATHDDDQLFACSMDQYRRILSRVQRFLLPDCPADFDLTPHSWRAAFVADSIVDGRPQGEVRTEGRWASESSFKVYLDVVGALSVQTHTATKRLIPAQQFALAHLEAYFPAFPPSRPGRHDADARPGQGPRHRQVRVPGHAWRHYVQGRGADAGGAPDGGDSSGSEGADCHPHADGPSAGALA